MRRIALFAAGSLAALAVAGCAAHPGAAATGSVRSCTASAAQAIRTHVVVTSLPAACQGLTRAQVNDAASVAIRQASGGGPKAVWRKQAGAAAPWVNLLLTGPVAASPAPEQVTAGGSSAPGGSRLGGVSELAVQIAALLAWLATAASGGYVLVRWLRAGGSLRGNSGTAAPSAVTAGHAGFGLLGLVLWITFMITGWTALAWTAVGLLGPVAGLGMGVLLLGLPSPRERHAQAAEQAPPAAGGVPPAAAGGTATLVTMPAPTAVRSPRPRIPVFVIAAHGLFAATLLLLVITATIGAG